MSFWALGVVMVLKFSFTGEDVEEVVRILPWCPRCDRREHFDEVPDRRGQPSTLGGYRFRRFVPRSIVSGLWLCISCAHGQELHSRRGQGGCG